MLQHTYDADSISFFLDDSSCSCLARSLSCAYVGRGGRGYNIRMERQMCVAEIREDNSTGSLVTEAVRALRSK